MHAYPQMRLIQAIVSFCFNFDKFDDLMAGLFSDMS
jgi:hypothetical protein